MTPQEARALTTASQAQNTTPLPAYLTAIYTAIEKEAKSGGRFVVLDSVSQAQRDALDHAGFMTEGGGKPTGIVRINW